MKNGNGLPRIASTAPMSMPTMTPRNGRALEAQPTPSAHEGGLEGAPCPVEDDLAAPLRSLLEIAEELTRAEIDAPVRPPVRPEELSEWVGLAPPRKPRPWEEVAADLKTLVLAGPRTTTRAFFNQLFGGRLGSATAADMLASLLNQSMYTYKVAGPQVLVERALIEHMGRLVGYESPDGMFAPGGSLSNLVAMSIARNVAFPEAREEGLQGRRPVVYVSEEAHYSIRKNAGLMGLGRSNVRSVSVDASGRMDVTSLQRAVRDDQSAGRDPFLVVATAGTTVRGAFDPLAPLADLVERHGLWLHVDGALGGSLLLSEKARSLLSGSARAQSFTWDAHKIMGVPLTSSVLLVKEPSHLDRSLSEQADYLFQAPLQQTPDPGHRSLQCGRRNDALKLWAAWQRHGDEGFGLRVDRCLALARLMSDKVRARPGLALFERPASTNVCFWVPGVDVVKVADRLNQSGQAMVGTAKVPLDADRIEVIRWVAVNPSVEEADLDRFLDAVEQIAGEMR